MGRKEKTDRPKNVMPREERKLITNLKRAVEAFQRYKIKQNLLMCQGKLYATTLIRSKMSFLKKESMI